eukprot:568241-Pelagomonas_calceolata.AAC.1
MAILLCHIKVQNRDRPRCQCLCYYHPMLASWLLRTPTMQKRVKVDKPRKNNCTFAVPKPGLCLPNISHALGLMRMFTLSQVSTVPDLPAERGHAQECVSVSAGSLPWTDCDHRQQRGYRIEQASCESKCKDRS